MDQFLFFFLEDIHTYIEDLKLPKDVLSFMNKMMNFVSQNKLILITTVSELEETPCFFSISGSSRLQTLLFEGPKDEEITEMLLGTNPKIDIMEKLFPDEKNRAYAAKYISKLIGPDMLSIQRLLGVFKRKEIDVKSLTSDKEIEKFIEESLLLKNTFFSLMDDIELGPELKLMATLILICARFEPNNELYLTDKFFERFELGENAVSLEDFEKYFPLLAKKNLFLKKSNMEPIYAPHSRILIAEAVQWIEKSANKEELEKMETSFQD